MSSLLDQAFVDAKALKEAALKNAESTIVEKYSDEVKETLNKLLEQDELGLGAPMADPMGGAAPAADADVDVPLAATDGDELCPCPDEEEEQKVTIKFDELAEALQKLEEEADLVNELSPDGGSHQYEDDMRQFYGAETSRDKFEREQAAKKAAAAKKEKGEEEEDLDEELDLSALVAAVMENFDLDESEDELEEKVNPEEEDPVNPEEEDPKTGEWDPAKHYSESLDADSLIDAVVEKLTSEQYGHHAGQYAAGEDDYGKCKKEAIAQGMPKDEAHKKCDADHPRYGMEESKDGLDTDRLVDAVVEKLTVDMGADLSGWAGRRPEAKMYQMEKELAARRSTSLRQDSYLGRGMDDRTDTDPQKELEDLKQAQEEVVFENNQLKEKLQNYENVVEQLKESVTDVNLSNARLLYTNRVLRNTSLNERQKNKLADAISKAGSVPEAKTIFETLQSTVESTPKRGRGPQSLSETINRRSSILRASSRPEKTKVDPMADRMKKLAGIN